MKARNSSLRIEKDTFTEKQRAGGSIREYQYVAWALRGWVGGRRVRKQFKSREEAEGEKARLEIEAANAASPDVRAVLTRLSTEEIADAEACLRRLNGKTLPEVVDWYLLNYRPSVKETPVEEARAAFIAARTPHISKGALKDYQRSLRDLAAMFPKRGVHEFVSDDIEAVLKKYASSGPKRHNNMRSDLNAFFNFCMSPARKWTRENPVVGTTKFEIPRGIPDIITTEKAAELMAFLETYACGSRAKHRPGCLVPYFALCLFAGLRPSCDDGEVSKLARSPEVEKLIDRKLGVIRITPEISKVNAVRQVKIRQNLAAWLARYPISEFPIILPNMQDKVTEVRKKFGLTSDVLRHTMISNHVAAFKSLGEAALEAGNSEAMIRKHYLNMVSDADAAAFWQIMPKDGPVRLPFLLAA